MAKSVPHPISFLRSKTTPYITGTSAQPSATPNATDVAQRRRSAANSDSGSSRAESSRAVPQTEQFPQGDQLQPQPKDPAKGVASPPRLRASFDIRKAPAPGTTKLAENTIVPPINVLIVEDNPINQTILTTFMKRKKIKYDTAKDGQEAIDKYKSGNFHLILMDIQMPVMDGIEATRHIRHLETQVAGFPDLPDSPGSVPTPLRSPGSGLFRSSVIIVALTASSLQSDRVSALAAGCNDFLTKPVSLVWLNNKIIEWGSLKALQMYAAIAPASPPSEAPSRPSERKEDKFIDKKPSAPRRSLLMPSNATHGRHPSSGTTRSRRVSHGSSSSEGGDSLGSSDENPPASGPTSRKP